MDIRVNMVIIASTVPLSGRKHPLAQEQLQLVAFSTPQSNGRRAALFRGSRNQALNPIWTKRAANFGGKLLTVAQCILGQCLSWDKRAKPPSRIAETCLVHLEEKRRHLITHFRFEDSGAVRIQRHEASICGALRPSSVLCWRALKYPLEITRGSSR